METVPSRKDCKFCEIASRNAKAHIVFSDEDAVAFLDSHPLFSGHCLLIPVGHYETLSDVPKDKVGRLFIDARLIAAAVQKGMAADGSFLAINNRVSQSVPHVHIHIVPRKEKDGLRGFFWPRQKYPSDQAIFDTQNAIERAVAELLANPDY